MTKAARVEGSEACVAGTDNVGAAATRGEVNTVDLMPITPVVTEVTASLLGNLRVEVVVFSIPPLCTWYPKVLSLGHLWGTCE